MVISAGPARAQQVLREALAKGADRAIHLEDNRFLTLDRLNTAKALVAAIQNESFDLVFTGLQSDDYGYAQTGVSMAELRGWPHATIIMQIEKTADGIPVKRELEGNFFQYVDMPIPAVLTIQSGINKLRYATLIGIKQSKNKPLRKVSWDEISPALSDDKIRIERLYIPQFIQVRQPKLVLLPHTYGKTESRSNARKLNQSRLHKKLDTTRESDLDLPPCSSSSFHTANSS